MNHSQLRKVCAQAVDEFVTKYPEVDYKQFIIAMDLKYGISELMIKKKLQQYNFKIINGELQKVET
jgi:hypothetical protein